jgi:hypothetical protein
MPILTLVSAYVLLMRNIFCGKNSICASDVQNECFSYYAVVFDSNIYFPLSAWYRGK